MVYKYFQLTNPVIIEFSVYVLPFENVFNKLPKKTYFFVPLFNAPDNIFIKDPIHNLLNVITFTFFKYDVNNIADRTVKNTANIA